MSEQRDKAFVRASIDQGLSSLEGNPFLAQRVLAQANGKDEIVVKKKNSVSFVLVMMLLFLMASAALAAGLIFSPKADAGTAADQALESRYGITAEMQTWFSRVVARQPDGSYVVTYTGVPGLDQVLGTYTIRVNGNRIDTAWSHDGDDTTGGLTAPAWGVDQLTEMMAIKKEHWNDVDTSVYDAALAAGQSTPMPLATPDPATMMTEEAWNAKQRALLKQSKLSISEMQEMAIMAMRERWQLTDSQIEKLEFNPDMTWFKKIDGVLYCSVCYQLTQLPFVDDFTLPEYTEMDGVYSVLINTETGEIDDVIYESALGGNG